MIINNKLHEIVYYQDDLWITSITNYNSTPRIMIYNHEHVNIYNIPVIDNIEDDQDST